MNNHTILNSMTEAPEKMRTVRVNDRGQLVIPEDMRRDLQIDADTVLVLLERDDHIILRREADVLRDLDLAWRHGARRALVHAWGDEDKVWDQDHETGA